MLARESLRKLACRKSGFDVNPFYSSNILRVFAALNLSGIGLKQPTGKGIIGPRKSVLDGRLGIEGLRMGMRRRIRLQTRLRLTRAQLDLVKFS